MSFKNISSQVAILAGGMGSRLKSRTGNLPKPMAPVMGRPVLEHQIELCKRHGFIRIALLVHYEYEGICAYFDDGKRWGVELAYHVEQNARGTAGALLDACEGLDDRFIVLYGDTYADVDLCAIWDSHTASGAHATLFLHPNDHPHDSDLVEVDNNSRLVAMHPYPHPESELYPNLVNAALYVLERDILKRVVSATGKSDLAKHTFPAMLAAKMPIHAYRTPEYIKDMGTPDRIDKVERDILVGLPERLSSRQLRQAVFMDRDGTLNVEVNHLHLPSQLELLPGVAEATHALNRAGVLAIGVTNQPVVARGDVTWEELHRIHAKLDELLGQGKAYLDRLYVCPHHPERGFAGEVPELKIDCDCRKPRTGMFDRAVVELNIDRRSSWMVGDTTSDIRAGKNAGLRTILVRTGYAGLDGKYSDEPDYVMPDYSAAVDWILRGHSSIARQLFSVTASIVKAKQRLILVAGPARAGKSSTACVLAEQLRASGWVVHVLSLDSWLQPIDQRPEGGGVLNRYDMQAVLSTLTPILEGGRHWIQLPFYERMSRTLKSGLQHSIGPEDLIILEGVPALLEPALIDSADIRVFVDVDDDNRVRRLKDDYTWRGASWDDVETRLHSRDRDELPAVRASAKYATHYITSY